MRQLVKPSVSWRKLALLPRKPLRWSHELYTMTALSSVESAEDCRWIPVWWATTSVQWFCFCSEVSSNLSTLHRVSMQGIQSGNNKKEVFSKTAIKSARTLEKYENSDHPSILTGCESSIKQHLQKLAKIQTFSQLAKKPELLQNLENFDRRDRFR